MIAQLEKLPLEFSPGEPGIIPSSSDVLGYLVEKISGQAFGDFVRRRILQPLGMTRYRFLRRRRTSATASPPATMPRTASCCL